MAAQSQGEAQGVAAAEKETAVAQAPASHWNLASRVAFRFCFIYFTLFSLSNQILGSMLVIPKLDIPEFGIIWPMRQVTFWTATHVFRVTRTLVYTGSGSGDKTYDWVQMFCLLVFAAAITLVWSLLDRRRPNYVTLHKWFRLVLRFALAGQMLVYGLDKIIPLQMPFPSLTRLMEPYGNFAPMSVLWFSVGASRAYEIFAGSAETLGGLLLIYPRTTTLGAMVCLADMIQVFTLNMTYDVPVKMLSFHLIAFSLFLLAPELRRLASVLFTDRVTGPSTQPPLFQKTRRNRIALVLQVLFGLYLAGMNLYGSIGAWTQYGGGRPKSLLYGIWNVEQMTIDGQVRSPLLTDYDRWRRVIFDSTEITSFERMDDTFTYYRSTLSDKDKTIYLTKNNDKNWKARFSFARPAPDQLTLDGAMDGHKIQMQLKLLDREKLTLVNRGFHWINEYPFQR
jgi:uncharacterized membrane protein YphA (DoxX/SURF4 family)